DPGFLHGADAGNQGAHSVFERSAEGYRGKRKGGFYRVQVYFSRCCLVLRDAADMVVQGKGKFEELMVCSHEIAASTAQLVAASKVKADKDSANLHRLQQASRGVTQATATVVASTNMTLTQIKRQEMDAQVTVLELETRLQKERERLGELRKKHYELAGVAEGWGEEEEGDDKKKINSCGTTFQRGFLEVMWLKCLEFLLFFLCRHGMKPSSTHRPAFLRLLLFIETRFCLFRPFLTFIYLLYPSQMKRCFFFRIPSLLCTSRHTFHVKPYNRGRAAASGVRKDERLTSPLLHPASGPLLRKAAAAAAMCFSCPCFNDRALSRI
ncbi:hypothetical protein GOODEAATRI_026300, partial [Goodea atripinnis]